MVRPLRSVRGWSPEWPDAGAPRTKQTNNYLPNWRTFTSSTNARTYYTQRNKTLTKQCSASKKTPVLLNFESPPSVVRKLSSEFCCGSWQRNTGMWVTEACQINSHWPASPRLPGERLRLANGRRMWQWNTEMEFREGREQLILASHPRVRLFEFSFAFSFAYWNPYPSERLNLQFYKSLHATAARKNEKNSKQLIRQYFLKTAIKTYLKIFQLFRYGVGIIEMFLKAAGLKPRNI